MRGPKPTLADIVLLLGPPEPVSLQCHEQLDSSDEEDGGGLDYVVEEDNSNNHQPTEPDQQAWYRVVTECTSCHRAVRLVVEGSEGDLRALQQLLLGTFSIVCPSCA
ncbi:E7 [Macaca fuscata papillomavirus 2]|uniref:Protein E7 n=1 Tax=Macaca fuscata papillomavirus 2 TaxID=2506204 RepID=A0A3R5X760_9PAPI|nr:E7 [Macaca fuscata papillomavirus 2]